MLLQGANADFKSLELATTLGQPPSSRLWELAVWEWGRMRLYLSPSHARIKAEAGNPTRREGEPFNLEKTANPTEPNVAQPSAKATHVAPGDFFVLTFRKALKDENSGWAPAV